MVYAKLGDITCRRTALNSDEQISRCIRLSVPQGMTLTLLKVGAHHTNLAVLTTLNLRINVQEFHALPGRAFVRGGVRFVAYEG